MRVWRMSLRRREVPSSHEMAQINNIRFNGCSGSMFLVVIKKHENLLYFSWNEKQKSINNLIFQSLLNQCFFSDKINNYNSWLVINTMYSFIRCNTQNKMFKGATITKKVNRKVQGVPQSQTAVKLWHQEQEKTDRNWRVQNKQTNAREANRPAPSSPKEVITMLNRTDNKSKAWQHKTHHSNNHKAKQTKNHGRTTALERSVA